MLKWLKRIVGLGWRTDDDEIEGLSHPSPDSAGLFYHVRRLGDRRPPSSGLPRCATLACKRLFEPTRSRVGEPQTLCEACLQAAEERTRARAERLRRLREALAERKARKGHPVLVGGEKGKGAGRANGECVRERRGVGTTRVLGAQGVEVLAAAARAAEAS